MMIRFLGLVSLATCVAAFSPQIGRASRSSPASKTAIRAFKSSTITKTLSTLSTTANTLLTDPMSTLPWNKRKEKMRSMRRDRREAARLHRKLGVSEDATFEEIMGRVRYLKAMAYGDVKELVRIDVAKDRILEYRLVKRKEGVVADEEAIFFEQGQEDTNNEEADMEKKKKQEKRSQWRKDLIVKPDEDWKRLQTRVWGVVAAFGAVFPPAVEQLSFLQFMFLLGQLMNRGVGSSGSFSFIDRRNVKGRLKATLIAIVVFPLAKLTGAILTPPAIRATKRANTVRFPIECIVCAFANLYLQPCKSGDSEE